MHPLLAAWTLSTLLAEPMQGPGRNAAPAPAPAASQGGQSGQKVPPIQISGDDYILTFDETGGESALTLEYFVKLCQEFTGRNFTYSRDTGQALSQLKLKMYGPKRVPKKDFYSFFQIMMVITSSSARRSALKIFPWC